MYRNPQTKNRVNSSNHINASYRLAYAAFTLAELLISLAVLGIIAVFTIPKLLSVNEEQKNRAITKEIASSVAGAYSNFKLHNTPLATTTMDVLLPFLNYTNIYAGSPNMKRLFFHNGGNVSYVITQGFGATSANNALFFKVEPSTRADEIGDNDVCFALTYRGRLTTASQLLSGTALSSIVGTFECPLVVPSYMQKWN
ncbi:MAG: prepilin-type N-terminal cleavage/methylation domain-containing protein [Cyanobacteria bacterium]|nr:prepilin-type N-terminal cleavage/methylation domain-containing protein [Cyanobacteriota bacterium]